MKSFLHVGCGPKRKDGTTKGFNTSDWNEIRFDIDESVNPDLIGTMTDMSSVETGSVDALFSSHNIEHLYPHEVPVALKEFFRVVKDDGFVAITCPDLKPYCELILQDKLTEPAYFSPAGGITPLDALYGHFSAMEKGNLYMAHRCGFTKTTLTVDLQKAGFTTIGVLEIPEQFVLWAIASKKAMSQEEMQKLFIEQLVI